MTTTTTFPPFYVVAACLGGLGGLVLGYDIGVITGALESLEDDWGTIDGMIRGLIVAALPLGQAPGSLIGGYVSDRFGRLRGILLQCIVYFLGGFTLASANSLALIVIGRFITGFGVGVSVSSNVPWMSEMCPTSRRGAVTSFYELMVTIGVLLGYVTFYVMRDNKGAWKYMFLLSCILAVPQIIFVWFVPESPRWLYSRGKEKQAKTQLLMMNDNDTEKVRLAMEEIRSDVSNKARDVKSASSLDEWKESLFVVLTLSFLAFFTGGINVRTYAPRIYTSVGMSDNMAASMTVVLGGIKVVSTLIAVLFIDELGRKTLLKVGLFLAGIGSFMLIIIGILDEKNEFGDTLVVLALSVYVIAYQVSFGPCLFTLGAEMFPSLIRGKMLSFQVIFSSLSDSTSTEIFSVLLDLFGVTIPFAGHLFFCILGYLFVKLCFVETAKKRPDVIRDELRQNSYLKLVIAYVCCNGCRTLRSWLGESLTDVPLNMARRFTSSAGFESLPTTDDMYDYEERDKEEEEEENRVDVVKDIASKNDNENDIFAGSI